MKKILLLLAFFASALVPTSSSSESLGGFSRNGFYESDNNAPKSYKRVADPTGVAPTSKVYSFSISNGFCSNNSYHGKKGYSDCKWQSVRSMLHEDVYKNGTKVQPKTSWYGWYMYLPENFPLRGEQVKGQYMFAEFHNGQCPHIAFVNSTHEDENLYFVTNRALGNYECDRDAQVKIGSLRSMRGKWTKFELYVDWSKSDGVAQMFIDDVSVLSYKGRTLTKGHEDLNFFAFGIYLCCTAGVEKVVGTQVLFSNVRSAKTREGLKFD